APERRVRDHWHGGPGAPHERDRGHADEHHDGRSGKFGGIRREIAAHRQPADNTPHTCQPKLAPPRNTSVLQMAHTPSSPRGGDGDATSRSARGAPCARTTAAAATRGTSCRTTTRAARPIAGVKTGSRVSAIA